VGFPMYHATKGKGKVPAFGDWGLWGVAVSIFGQGN